MEVAVLKMVHHPNIIEFVDTFQDAHFVYVVMERHGCEWGEAPRDVPPSLPCRPPKLGREHERLPVALPVRRPCDLFECLQQHQGLPEARARLVFAQIVDAVHYLSTLGVYHRDLKDENCVVDAAFQVKLVDFGSAVLISENALERLLSKFCGTLSFASSEILAGRQYAAPSADVWSLGVLLSILVTGTCPFATPEAAIKGELGSARARFSDGSWDVLTSCLHVDPARRITIPSLHKHPWVSCARDTRTCAELPIPP
ncbi:non-specific serine/threonine protein kinase [Malassezia sp. CBS 17886]|nr:non-specific serine/threonine protein kinase [Malassezia sp. CBS 17886]